MKLRNEFLTHRSGAESFIVPADGAKFSGLIRGNKTFGDVVELLMNDTNENAIIHALTQKYSAPEGMIERDVSKALKILQEAGALEL